MKKTILTCLGVLLALSVLCLGGAGVMFATKLCPPKGPWPMPPWCEGGVALPGLPGMPVSPGLPTAKDSFAYYRPGEIAGLLDGPVFLISPHFGKPETMIPSTGAGWASLKEDVWSPQAVRLLHGQGLHLLGASMTIRHLNLDAADPHPEMAALDLDGNPIPMAKPGMAAYLEGDPEWQERLLKQGRAFVDMGAEGIVMDEPNTYGSLVFEYGGSFDAHSLAGFRDYLAARYDPARLEQLFGITDISTFDLRQHILDNGLRDAWNASDQNPSLLTYEFFCFQNQGADAFLRRFATELRDYARTEYGRDFVFSFNASPQYDFSRFLPVDYLDYLTGEMFYFAPGHTRAALVAKLAQATKVDKILLLTEVGHDTGELPARTANLFKYMFADIYSSAGTGMILPTDGVYTMRGGSYVEPFVQTDLAETERYVRFMNEHASLFDLAEPARVAVVHSAASYVSNRLPTAEPLWGSHETLAVMEVLLTERIPFGMLTSGDGLWAEDQLSLEDLGAYAVVVLPNVQLISSEEVQALLTYVRQGGVVIQVNGFGSYNLAGTAAGRPELTALRHPGAHPLGEGTWHTLELWEELGPYRWNEAEGRNLQPTEHSGEEPAAVALRAVLREYTEPEIVTDAPITVGIRRYGDGSRWVVHLVNADYNQTTDRFTPAGPFEVGVDTSGVSIASALLYDFEAGSVTELPVTVKDQRATFGLPSLYAYSIVELLP
jgi:hypothetical protein